VWLAVVQCCSCTQDVEDVGFRGDVWLAVVQCCSCTQDVEGSGIIKPKP
jgi:hypothetical protein